MSSKQRQYWKSFSAHYLTVHCLTRKGLAALFLLLLFYLCLPATRAPAQSVDLEDQVRSVAAELRCVVCQNLSVADSPSEMAQQMRALIKEQLQEGKTPAEIKAYFVSKYGEWVLLAPPPKGFNLVVWVLPFIVLFAGVIFVIFVVKRWAHKKNLPKSTTVDPTLIVRVRRETAAERPIQVNPEIESPHPLLLQEQNRLYADLRELEFDYQAGKLSEADYQELRHELETQAAMVLKELDSSAPKASSAQSPATTPKASDEKAPAGKRTSPHGWQLAAGGIFLLLFGITLGVLLSKSLRPRISDADNITGDFLTGTGQGGIGGSLRADGKDLASLLAQGRAAFERKEWPKAIDVFKRALTIDANQPEAHTYMGLILAQAGHADGALLAFDRALSADPSFPLALWGKGMLLYRAKEDFSGARQTLEKLFTLMPPGEERNEVQKTIAEIASIGASRKQPTEKVKEAQANIQGTVSIDPKLKDKVDNQSVLFIIARSVDSAGGPPLAVKKIERPVFPLAYSLGPENVMMPGVAFSGKVLISARLDKDGNPMTREPGNLMGEYKKNPAEIGSKKVDIVIDHMM